MVDADGGDAPLSLARLHQGDYLRLEGWRVLAHKQKLCDSSFMAWREGTNVCLCAVGQRSEFIKALATTAFPALLTKSKYIDLVQRRQVAAMELWLVQGFPHPSVPGLPDRLAMYFPAPALVNAACGSDDSLSVAAQRRLTGNSMHWSQIGVWFFYNLLVCDAAGLSVG